MAKSRLSFSSHWNSKSGEFVRGHPAFGNDFRCGSCGDLPPCGCHCYAAHVCSVFAVLEYGYRYLIMYLSYCCIVLYRTYPSSTCGLIINKCNGTFVAGVRNIYINVRNTQRYYRYLDPLSVPNTRTVAVSSPSKCERATLYTVIFIKCVFVTR